jgi:hypothetical protein
MTTKKPDSTAIAVFKMVLNDVIDENELIEMMVEIGDRLFDHAPYAMPTAIERLVRVVAGMDAPGTPCIGDPDFTYPD